jgi:murein DD-endopeptidase MepM/ murein hydrolase activator NlpD
VATRTRIAVAVALVVAAGAVIVADDSTHAARSLGEVEQAAREAAAKEQVLTGDITRYNARIRAVEVRLAPVEARWTALNTELEGLRVRRRALTAELDRERARLAKLNRILAAQQGALAARLAAAYRVGEPSMLQVLLSSRSIAAAQEARDNIRRIANQDRTLIVETRSSATQARVARDRIRAARAEVWQNEKTVAVKEGEAKKAFDVINSEKVRLVAARRARNVLLANVTADRRELEAEARDLRARSNALGRQIRSSSANLPATVAVGGSGQLAWPVNGPLTSPFGWRWGRMHEGIDIGAPTGAPIGASAAGTVVVAGWSGGYGNLVVVSHGSISTAYAHMSRIGVSVGQSVSRGTVLGAVGCTGHCFGAHVHFEVRVNGVPHNPVNYL